MCLWKRKDKQNVPLSDLVKLLWVVDDDLDSHLHLGLLQAEVKASNLGIGNTLYHAFMKNKQTKSISIKIDYTLQNNQDKTANVILIWANTSCLARKEVPQFPNYCVDIPLKASLLSPTRITAYAIRWDIAANLNGSLIAHSDVYELLRNERTLWANGAVQCISIDQETFFLATSVGFQHIDGVDGVFGHPLTVHKLHSHGSIHHHVGEEVCITDGSGLRQIKALLTCRKCQF